MQTMLGLVLAAFSFAVRAHNERKTPVHGNGAGMNRPIYIKSAAKWDGTDFTSSATGCIMPRFSPFVNFFGDFSVDSPFFDEKQVILG